MERKRLARSLGLSLFVVAISFANYSRLSGTENVRAIHVVTLLTAGAGIGVFLVTLAMLFRNRNKGDR